MVNDPIESWRRERVRVSMFALCGMAVIVAINLGIVGAKLGDAARPVVAALSIPIIAIVAVVAHSLDKQLFAYLRATGPAVEHALLLDRIVYRSAIVAAIVNALSIGSFLAEGTTNTGLMIAGGVATTAVLMVHVVQTGVVLRIARGIPG